ncbi:MAG TPA: Gfo/Idh/MocA family oxidoreductase, partial [Bryobacteraceae bacterium]|nr:Gfo/Idh/MocA family oxidoreductase [Bryobacteraceae bacterium]
MKALNRRQFLGSSFCGAAVLAVAGQTSKAAASERLQVGCVGVAGRAGQLMQMFAGLKEVEVVALADVDSRKLPGAARSVEKIQGKKPATETDFRKLIDNSEIDALVVGTPDHWHAIPTILACMAGKDVYVEKPDGHNIEEGRRMVAAARKNKRIIQMGTQSRTSEYFHEAMAWIRSGKLVRCLVAKSWESARQG